MEVPPFTPLPPLPPPPLDAKAEKRAPPLLVPAPASLLLWEYGEEVAEEGVGEEEEEEEEPPPPPPEKGVLGAEAA